MSKRILTLCLALALCLSLIPAGIYAAEPQYTVKATKTSIKAGEVAMLDNGMGSYLVFGKYGLLESKGLVNSSGKSLMTRTAKKGETTEALGDNLHYASCDTMILDLQPVIRYANYTSDTKYVNTKPSDYAYVYNDYQFFSATGKTESYVSDILAKYDKVPVAQISLRSEIMIGNSGLVTFQASYPNGDDVSYYFVDLDAKKVLLKQPTADFPNLLYTDCPHYELSSLNDNLIAYKYYHQEKDEYFELSTVIDAAGYMDIQKRRQLPIETDKFDEWGDFNEGLASVKDKNGKWGYITRYGALSIPCNFEEVSAFHNGYARIADADGRFGYIDSKGKTVISPQYYKAENAGDGLFTVGKVDSSSLLYGVVDANNTEVVPFEYDSISAVYKDYAYACKDGYLYILKFSKNPKAGKPYQPIFKDVAETDWFEPYVRTAYENNIVAGVTTEFYAPLNNLKHAEIIVMVANLHSRQKEDQYDFQAHKADGTNWWDAYLNYCKAEGITDDRYDAVLDEYVTRSEMAYYFANALSADSYADKRSVTFSDVPGDVYEEEIHTLGRADIVTGDPSGTYRPADNVTRAEAAVFVTNLLKIINK
ncbi:MAG: WG repeat-containing protein [Firmicutes bacterium]|nr:WG repeat-containing protein [Bacillota bacterium]